MGQMNVSVTDHLSGFVRKKVLSGQYNSASEVVREALRRMEEEDARALRLSRPAAEDILADLDSVQVEAIRRRVRDAIAGIRAGRFTAIEDADDLSAFSAHIKSEGRKLPASRGRTRQPRSVSSRAEE